MIRCWRTVSERPGVNGRPVTSRGSKPRACRWPAYRSIARTRLRTRGRNEIVATRRPFGSDESCGAIAGESCPPRFQRMAAGTRRVCRGGVLSIRSGWDVDGQGGGYREYFGPAEAYITSEVVPTQNATSCWCPADARDRFRSFDCVFCSGVLAHVVRYTARLREISRILAPGGILLLSLPFSQGLRMEPTTTGASPSTAFDTCCARRTMWRSSWGPVRHPDDLRRRIGLCYARRSELGYC